MIRLTAIGHNKVENYIRSLEEERDDILSAHKDTTDNTHIPTIEEIKKDIEEQEDDYGNGCIEYCEYWGVTDHYDSESSLCLTRGIDYTDATKKTAILEAIETGSVNLYLFDTEEDARHYIEDEFKDEDFELLEVKSNCSEFSLGNPIQYIGSHVDPDVFRKNDWFCGSFDETYYWYQLLHFDIDPDAESNYGMISLKFAPGLIAETATWHIRVVKVDQSDIQYHIRQTDGAPCYEGTITVDLDSDKKVFEGLYYEDEEAV